ncbi:MAG: MoaD/ThiS family protein [Planctomycetes bacterium]|nr:MoaD/ThiS family protein [Planctomycetota bacterium]
MKLKLELYAALRERAGRSELVLEGLPEELGVDELKAALGRAHPELGSLEHVSVVVGTQYARAGQRLGAQDAIALLPPVSGG